MSRFTRKHTTTPVPGVTVHNGLAAIPVIHVVQSSDSAIVTTATTTPIGGGGPLLIRRVTVSDSYTYVP